jgi:hypothetical protein
LKKNQINNKKIIYIKSEKEKMSSEEEKIQKQIQPVIEKMVMDIMKSKPKDIVRIKLNLTQ